MKKLFVIATVLLLAKSVFAGSFLKGVKNVRLDNGLTVILKEDHTRPLVSVQVWVKVGSVNENVKTSGLSHFLEHLIFKGTDKYPGDEISRRTETQGGMINAATSKEFTHFYIDTQKEALKDTVSILADAMANAALPADEIEKERPVVLEEIKRHEDNPGSVLYELFSEALFVKSAYRASVIGSASVIKNVTRQDIMDYYKSHYVPSNMFVSIAGDIDIEGTLAVVKGTFGKQAGGTAPASPSLIEPTHKEECLRKTKNVEHAYWLGGFLGPDITSEEQFAADVTATILGGGRSSRFYRSLRENKRLVYSVGSSFWSQRGSGATVVSAIFSPEKEKAVASEISKEIEALALEGPSESELARVKELIASQWYFGRETLHDQAALLGYWYMQGNPDFIDSYIPGIEKVTKKDVQEFLKKYYAPQGLSQALIVPE